MPILTSVRKKGGGERETYVPLAPALAALLPLLPSYGTSRWVFPNAWNTGPDDGREFVRTVFKPALLAAGIERVKITERTERVRAGLGYRDVVKKTRAREGTLRWKDLRVTFATWADKGGASVQTIQKLLGHTTPRCTLGYVKSGTQAAHVAVAALPSLALPDFSADRTATSTATKVVREEPTSHVH